MSLPCGLGIAGLRETFPYPEGKSLFFMGNLYRLRLALCYPTTTGTTI